MLKQEAVQSSVEGFRAGEEMLRAIFDSSPDAITVSDLNGNIVDCNQAALDLHGYSSKEEVIGKSALEFIAKKDHKRAMQNLKKILEQGSVENIEYTFLAKDGREFPAELSASVIKDSSGNPTGFVAITKDITERKKAEERIRASEEMYRSLVELAPDGIITTDIKGVITSVNNAFLRLTSYTKEEIVGKHFTKLQTLRARDIPRYIKFMSSALRGKLPPPFEYSYVRKDGTIGWGEAHVGLLKKGGKTIGFQVILREISERKKAEQALKEREQRLRSIIDTSPDAIVWVDTAGKITLVNKKVFELTGFSEKDLIGKNFMDVEALIQESKEKILEAFMKRLQGIDTPPYEVEIVTKNGEIIPAELNASPIYEGGKIVGTQSVFRDLRERKKAEEMLRESEERFRNLYESIQDPLAVYVGREGRLLEYNKAFKEKTGYTDEELKDKTFLDFVHPDDHAVVLEKYRTKYPEEELPLVYEVRGVNKKGEIIPVEISVSPYKVKGKVIGIEVIHRDITERKKMEEKLRQYSEHLEELVQKRTQELLESEKRYSVLVEEARDGVVILQDGKIVFVNKMASEISGYSRDELIGLPLEKLVDEKYRQLVIERYTQRLRGEKIPSTYEIEVIAKSGERVPVELSATRISYQGRSADLVIARDIRERKRMEEERLRLERLVAIGEVATMVGHDLRNPLQSIENATYYLNHELPRLPIPQKAIEMLQVISNSVEYADNIVRNLHDFAATKKPVLQKTNVNTIVKETLSQVEIPKNVELTTELADVPKIKADKGMIKRVFLNLAINGIQAMEKKGGTLKVSTKKTKGFVEVSFKDTGIGIAKEDLKKIFAPFFTTRAQGMGMGLPICKKFVEAHGGSIEVESEEGKGTTFMVKLPIQRENGGENR